MKRCINDDGEDTPTKSHINKNAGRYARWFTLVMLMTLITLLYTADDETSLVPPKRLRDFKKQLRSQGGQDEFVFTRFFVDRVRPGTFVEFGARNGVDDSNTYFFEHHLGWRGVLIEAADYELGNITASRPKSLILQGGICANHTMRSFSSTSKASGLGGASATFYKDRLHHVKATTTIKCYTLNEGLFIHSLRTYL